MQLLGKCVFWLQGGTAEEALLKGKNNCNSALSEEEKFDLNTNDVSWSCKKTCYNRAPCVIANKWSK